MNSETAKAIEYGQRLLDAAIDLVSNAKVELDDQWARHPQVVALTILCRTICNFRASLRLAQDEQVVEARALVRLMYENVLWLNMVRVRGAKFVEEMRQDEFANDASHRTPRSRVSGRNLRRTVGGSRRLPIRS